MDEEDEEDDDEDEGVGPGCVEGGLDGLGPIPQKG